MCLGAEVRMRAEHTLEKKDKLKDKCPEQAALLSEKVTEIADQKSLLILKEAEAAEAIRCRGQLAIVEVADAVKGNELRDLKEKNFALKGEKDVAQLASELSSFQLLRDELNSKVASLESERDRLADQDIDQLKAYNVPMLRIMTHRDVRKLVISFLSFVTMEGGKYFPRNIFTICSNVLIEFIGKRSNQAVA
nr:hypothetical protein [Tanacetum cinerariifolium]